MFCKYLARINIDKSGSVPHAYFIYAGLLMASNLDVIAYNTRSYR